MKYVYSPSGSAEAHMIAHMLEQYGINANIHGESLLGAVGELPAAGLVKIAVADEDYDKARKLILEWEKKNPPETTSQASPKTSKVSLLCAALIGVGLGWVINDQSYVMNPSDKVDQNNDGKPDLIWHFKNKNAAFPEKSENDINFDGKFDIITRFDSQGRFVSDKADNNFDGIFETFTTYKNSIPEQSEIDTDGDGKADIVNFFEHGILNRTEILNPKTDKIARINYYENAMLKSADWDSDRDGILDTRYSYDRYEQVIDTKKI